MNKIQIASASFDLIRHDFRDNNMMDFYISPGTVTISELTELVKSAHGTFIYTDPYGEVIDVYSNYTILNSIRQSDGYYEVDGDVVIISVGQKSVIEEVARNSVNIEYIAAMSDIDLEN